MNEKKESLKPTNKVTAGGIVGAVAAVAVWISSQFGLDMPAHVAIGLATLAMKVIEYFVNDS